MSFDDALLGTTLCGLGFSAAYLGAEFSLWRRREARERRRGARLLRLYGVTGAQPTGREKIVSSTWPIRAARHFIARFNFKIVVKAFVALTPAVVAVASCSAGPHDLFNGTPAPLYSLGGTVNGLVGNGLILVNAGTEWSVDPSASDTYPSLLAGFSSGTAYEVSIVTQPSNPSQSCILTNGSGTVANANVTNLLITCTTLASRFVYVVNSASNNVSAYAIAASSGVLTSVAGSPFAVGTAPSSIAVDPTGKFAYVVNSQDGAVSAFTVDGSGALIPVAGSPFASGAGSSAVAVSPDSQFLYVISSTQATVTTFAIATSGALTAVGGSAVATGVHPDAVYVDPLNQYLYVANGGSNSVSDYQRNTNTGVATALGSSPVASGHLPSAMTSDPSGTLVYVANKMDGTVSAYTSLASATPSAEIGLTAINGSPFLSGSGPDAVASDSSGKFLYVANGGDGTVSVYAIDSVSGALTAASNSPFAAGTAPSAVAIDNQNQFVYVANNGTNDVSAYSISATTGTLAPIAGSPFATGIAPTSIAIVN